MDIGKDNGEVVSATYKAKAPFAFTGKIGKVVFDLAPQKLGAPGTPADAAGTPDTGHEELK